jgi:hypothetical protein
MYAFRLPKAALWDTLAEVRAFYAAEHPVATTLLRNVAAARTHPEKLDVFLRLMEEVADRSDRDWTVQWQLFDEGEAWIVRPLELGWRFLNEHHRWPALEPVFYDNRSDVPPEHEKNEAVALWVDEQVRARRYLVTPVFDKDVLQEMSWRAFEAAGEQG